MKTLSKCMLGLALFFVVASSARAEEVMIDQDQSVQELTLDEQVILDQKAEDAEVEMFGQERRRLTTCYASNLRGQVFTAVGLFPAIVQNRALNKCLQVSFRCHERGCR